MNKKNQVWFITGASSGFGKAFAEFALKKGYRIIITARRMDLLENIRQTSPDQVEAIQMDVTDSGEINRAVDQAVKRFGQIDVLINNAGFSILGAVEETPIESLRSQMETNFFGAVQMIKSLLPIFRKQRSGAIVNISSLGGQLSFAGFSAYSASKFALEGMSEALSAELKPFNVHVMIVEPGQFRTEFAGRSMQRVPPMDAYKDTVGETRVFAEGMHNTQPGDPMKAAQAIDTALQSDEPPLRLVLGADAIDAVKGHAEQVIAEIEKWKSVSLDTVFD